MDKLNIDIERGILVVIKKIERHKMQCMHLGVYLPGELKIPLGLLKRDLCNNCIFQHVLVKSSTWLLRPPSDRCQQWLSKVKRKT